MTHCYLPGLISAYPTSNVQHLLLFFVLFLGNFLNSSSCGCSTAKSTTPPHETFFPPLNGTEHGPKPSLVTRDRELVSVLQVRIKHGDLNPRPLTPQSVTLPTIPRAGPRLDTDDAIVWFCPGLQNQIFYFNSDDANSERA